MGSEMCIRDSCTADSLIIGDELCSGTETTSAVAIVGASVGEIVASGAHFLFATHLHELRSIPDIAGDARVRCVHMKVDIDADGLMTYRRTLAEGCGPDTYGIEACAGFGLPRSFLRSARRYRQLLTPGGRSGRSMLHASAYNQAVFCGGSSPCSVPGCTELAVETHHLVHQATANAAGGLGDGRTVNARSNLMPLCRKHHACMHAPGAPSIAAEWVQTSRGVRPNVAECVMVQQASTRDVVLSLIHI